MSVKWRVRNPDLINEEKTFLTSDYSSDVNLTVRNNDGFTANWFAVVGEPSQEQTESKTINSTSGNETVVLSAALKFSHPKSCPVYETQWDQICMERSSSEDSGFAEIADSPFTIEWDNKDSMTTILDSAGSTAHYYRWRFKNSNTGTYSSYSGVVSGGGLSRNQAGYVIKNVRKVPISKGVSDTTIYDFINDFNDLNYEQMPEAWWFEREGTAISTAEDTYKYSISTNWSDLQSIKYVLYRYISGSNDITYPLKYTTPLEFYNLKADANQSSSDNVTKWSLLPVDSSSAKGYIGLHSTPESDDCYIKPVYYIELETVNSFEDILVVPSPKAYEDYVLYRIADDIKQDGQTATIYNSRVNSDIVSLKRRAKRQLGQKEFTRFRGQKGYSRLFGSINASNDSYRENYW